MKKLFCCLLSTLLSLSIVGCSSNAYSVFKLGNKKYDLSGDMNETITTMAKEGYGFRDISDLSFISCDSTGELVTDISIHLSGFDFVNNPGIIWFRDYYNILNTHLSTPPTYYYGITPEFVPEYQTIHGITNSSTSKDIETLKGFLPCFSYIDTDSDAVGYFSLYVDGRQVNVSDYNDALETILNYSTEDSPALDAMESYSHYDLTPAVPAFWQHIGRSLMQQITLFELKSQLEDDERLKNSFLVTLAYTEALQKSIDGEVDKIEMYIYTAGEYGISVDYFVYNIANATN